LSYKKDVAMIEEVLPRPTLQRAIKILSPDTGFANLPAINTHISFLPFLNYLKEQLPTTSGNRTNFYKYLIEKFESDPTLLTPVKDKDPLTNHQELLEFLSTAIFPVVTSEQESNFTLSGPYNFNVFSYSEPFKKLFIDENEEHLELPAEMTEENLRQIQCSMIYDHVLSKYYGIKLNECPDLVFPVLNEQTGMKRYYRMRYDRRFIELSLKGPLPLIQDCAVCLNTFRILDLDHQLKAMPLDLFEAQGFAVWVAEDITTTESVERIKKVLLRQGECDASAIAEMKEAIHALIGLTGVEVGLMPFFRINNNFLMSEECTRHSLFAKDFREDDEQSQQAFDSFIRFQKENPEPMPVSIVDQSLFGFAPHLKPLYDRGTRSYAYYPIQNSEGLLGLLELSSTEPNVLTQQVIANLETAIPLLSLAMLKSRDEFDNRIEKLVKEKFTALQPSVEWKFSEVAWTYLQSKEQGSSTGKIIYDNVYPLYGAVDVRNSSVERSLALQKDLKKQLAVIDQTLEKLQENVQLTLLEGLKFKINNFQLAISEVLLPEDEIHINDFLVNEVEPVFNHLQKGNPVVEAIVDNYFQLEKDCDGPLYQYRNEYENTLASITQSVTRYLEEQEEGLQKSFPHYFEKYRTDGIEYNIYIGQSMAPAQPFDLLYLKNIRLWQLQSMAEICRITHALLPTFSTPLETTQLILIHNQPISIGFRKDERRFDVEGSYNIRYEVMKKRIDKALIKDTHERLTQPGKIALVYSNQKEVQEYEEYIGFLQSKGLLHKQTEYLELEEMQGLKGMKALRVEVVQGP
jgi:hypothetical protein